jgi:hypothetical protein
MLRRLIACLALLVAPAAVAAAPAFPAPATPSIIQNAVFDKYTKSTANTSTLKTQGIQAFNVTAHDQNYSYTFPLCSDSTLVEATGQGISDPTSFVVGDTLTITLNPNPATDTKACYIRILRQQISPGPSGGECLQHFQVKHEIVGDPDKLFLGTEYDYQVTVYNRPTIDCDGKALGAAPITTTVAQGKPFSVSLTRGGKEVLHWSLTTDTTGKADFPYTFSDPGDYQFKMTPGGNALAGDEIDWTSSVIDPNPSPSATPKATVAAPNVGLWPLISLIVFILAAGGFFEYRHRIRKQRVNELPEDEYNRTPKL